MSAKHIAVCQEDLARASIIAVDERTKSPRKGNAGNRIAGSNPARALRRMAAKPGPPTFGAYARVCGSGLRINHPTSSVLAFLGPLAKAGGLTICLQTSILAKLSMGYMALVKTKCCASLTAFHGFDYFFVNRPTKG